MKEHFLVFVNQRPKRKKEKKIYTSVTIVRLGADVVGSSPAARQFFFMYFPLTHSVSFFFYIFWCRYRPCGLKGTVWDGDLATVLDWRGLSTTGL